MADRTCSVDGCAKPHRARGLCTTHYNQSKPDRHRKAEVACTGCGKSVLKYPAGKRKPFCSWPCQLAYQRTDPTHTWGGSVRRKPSVPVQMAFQFDNRSDLRIALDDGDTQGVIAAIRKHCDVTESGCWLWKRSTHDGYATVPVGKRKAPVHRIVAEAKYGAPLGKQPVHHICANTKCVAPEHLIPVTHRENVAEMLARRYFESRIADLEAALSELAPSHPLLSVIGHRAA